MNDQPMVLSGLQVTVNDLLIVGEQRLSFFCQNDHVNNHWRQGVLQGRFEHFVKFNCSEKFSGFLISLVQLTEYDFHK